MEEKPKIFITINKEMVPTCYAEVHRVYEASEIGKENQRKKYEK